MRKDRYLVLTIILSICFLASCTKAQPVIAIKNYISSVEKISVDHDIKIVGLGEATHGNSELQTLKLDVFKALIENNNCRIFAIEGDFGGSAKVNEYIAGGTGTAKEATAAIGFAIYNTQEMADLIEWMRNYNQTASENKKLKFYGFDMQRYDNNKELLFNYLSQVNTQLSKEYSTLLSDLNDKTVYTQDKIKVQTAMTKVDKLIKLMMTSKKDFIAQSSEKEFAFALQCAQSIKENATLRSSGVNYANMRDQYMKDKIDWILNYEENQMIFITGHNGHIEKTSSSAGFTCMGERLAESYGKAYYAIGTDFLESTFNVVNSSGKDIIMTLNNTNALTDQFRNLEDNIYFMDFTSAKENKELKKILDSQLAMTNIGAEFNSWQKAIKAFYTLKIVPSQAYDGMIVLQKMHPSTKIDFK